MYLFSRAANWITILVSCLASSIPIVKCLNWMQAVLTRCFCWVTNRFACVRGCTFYSIAPTLCNTFHWMHRIHTASMCVFSEEIIFMCTSHHFCIITVLYVRFPHYFAFNFSWHAVYFALFVFSSFNFPHDVDGITHPPRPPSSFTKSSGFL